MWLRRASLYSRAMRLSFASRSFSVCSCVVLCSIALALTACGAERRRPPGVGRFDGGGGGSGDGGGGGRDAMIPDLGIPPSSCVADARFIYLVDSGNALLRFDPESRAITPIGTLACAPGASPFSMAVDRNANALILHSDRRIYQASTSDASCAPTPYVPGGMGFELFGMGFVSDVAGGSTESLFIAGGPEAGVGSGSATLGAIRTADWSVSTVGPVAGSPELTGNGEAELWGFFPDAMPMAVRQLDKVTGATLREFDVSSIDTSFLPIPSAWAFAYWGGRYYIFYLGALGTSSSIFRLTPDTGAVEPVIMDTGYRIVGAGVSTCAPTILI